MKAAITIDQKRLKGDVRKIQKALKQLGKASRQRTVVRKALRAAASPINKAAKAKAPKRTGALKKSIGIVMRTYSGSGQVLAVIGPRKGFSVPDETRKTGHHDPRYTAHLVEFGTAKMAPRPFLRPAFSSQQSQSQAVFRREFWKNFQKEVRRVAAKGKGR